MKKQIPITINFEPDRVVGWIEIDDKLEGLLASGHVLRPLVMTMEPSKENKLAGLGLVFDKELAEDIKKKTDAL